jgi:Zn-dependent M28 family amino/carboxypeptidase
LRRAGPGLEAVNYFMRSSDFKPFVDAGIPATSLTAKGGRRIWYYRTPDDTSEHLQPGLLEQTVQTVIALVQLLDEQMTERVPG